MANFDYKSFLKEGGIEKYLLEENFGNDIESRFQYIRPLMDRLPDTARTEAMLDGMVDARAEGDKPGVDFYFVETMKMLGLEDELIEDQDLEDYYDEYRFYKRQGNLDENDTYLDELLQMPDEEEEEGADIEVLDDVEELEIEKDITININLEEGKYNVGDEVILRGGSTVTDVLKVVDARRMFGSNLMAYTVEFPDGHVAEYDETQLSLNPGFAQDLETRADDYFSEPLKEFIGGDLEKRNESLYDKLVPGMGDAETVEGEMLRAINRIIYRYYNDGDKYFEGYGTETAGPAHSFLVNANTEVQSAMEKIFSTGTNYEETIEDALEHILSHIEGKQGKYTKNTVGGIFDYEPEFEDEEEDDDFDDYHGGYGYDDEDDDYYEK